MDATERAARVVLVGRGSDNAIGKWKQHLDEQREKAAPASFNSSPDTPK